LSCGSTRTTPKEKIAQLFGRNDVLVLAEVARQAFLWIAAQQGGPGISEEPHPGDGIDDGPRDEPLDDAQRISVTRGDRDGLNAMLEATRRGGSARSTSRASRG
jgi:hypothetical protein